MTFVQGNGTFTGSTFEGSLTVTFPSDVTAGNLLVAATQTISGDEYNSVTDTQGNTWTQATDFLSADGAGDRIGIWTAVAGTSGPNSVTASLFGSQNFSRLIVHEYAGVTATVDASHSTDIPGSGTTTHSVTLTTTHPDDLIFGWCVDENNVTGYVPPAVGRVTAGGEMTGDLATTTAGSYTISATTGALGGPMTAVAFVPAGPATVTGTAALPLGPLTIAAAGTVLAAGAGTALVALGPLVVRAGAAGRRQVTVTRPAPAGLTVARPGPAGVTVVRPAT